MRRVPRWLSAVWLGWLLTGSALAAAMSTAEVIVLPQEDGSWFVTQAIGTAEPPPSPGRVEIRGVGSFAFDPADVRAQRADLFAHGWLTAWDVLVALHERGDISLEWSYDEQRRSHRVESINGLEGWWYDVRLPGATFERTLLRMDMHPIREGATIYLYLEEPEFLQALDAEHRAEGARRVEEAGLLIIPEVLIKGPRNQVRFVDVAVTSHDVRPDVFRPGVITLLDVLLSMGEAGLLDGLALAWHENAESEHGSGHFWVQSIRMSDWLAEPPGMCEYMGWATATGLLAFQADHVHQDAHLHLSPDLVALVSPQRVIWEWMCVDDQEGSGE